jgi:hypothetical protein
MVTFTSSVDKIGTETVFILPNSINRDSYGWRRGGFAGNGVYVIERARNLIVICDAAYQGEIDGDVGWMGERWDRIGVVFVTSHFDSSYPPGGCLLAGSLISGSIPIQISTAEWELAYRWIRIGD